MKAQTQKQGNSCSTEKETKEDRGDSETSRGRTSTDAATSHAELLSQGWELCCEEQAICERAAVRHLEPRRTPTTPCTSGGPGTTQVRGGKQLSPLTRRGDQEKQQAQKKDWG